MQTFRPRTPRAYLYLAGAAAVVAIAVAVLSAGGGVASAHTSRVLVKDSARLASVSPTIPAKVDCATLKSLPSLVSIPHFPTSIDSAADVAAAGGNPEYCDVKGLIAPQTHFEMKLPVSTWQGRYLQNGCGGYCGTVSGQTFPACDAQLGGDFAMATDDEGHTTSSGLGGAGLFAFNSQKLRNEYGYESEHAMAVVGKTIITQLLLLRRLLGRRP
jgi:feruloyl esterase